MSASAIANSPIQLATLTSMTSAPISRQPVPLSAPVSRQPVTTPAPAASSSALTVPTAPTNAVVRFIPGRVKKLLKLPDLPTVIISAVIATIFGVPTWLSLRLAVWTSTKDFYELCLDNKSTFTGVRLEQCETAIQAGLPPPPLSNFKRAFSTRQSFRVHPTVKILKRAINAIGITSSTHIHSLPVRTYWAWDLTILTVPFVFIILTVAITQGKVAWRRLQASKRNDRTSLTTRHSYLGYTNHLTLVVSIIVLFGIFIHIILDLVRLRTGIKSASEAYFALCTAQKEHARLVHCNAALDTDNEHGKPYWLSLLDVVTILVISTAAVATILAMLSMFFLTGRRAVAWPFLTRTGLVDIMNQKGTEGASKKGDEESVKVLLDKGANVNAQGGQHGKALNAASVRGDEQVVKLLLDKGADVNAQGGPYGNALQAASAGGHEAPGPFQYNNKYQLWFRCEWNPNNGAFEFVQWMPQGWMPQGWMPPGWNPMLDNGANVNAQGGRYSNALQAASAGGHEALVRLLPASPVTPQHFRPLTLNPPVNNYGTGGSPASPSPGGPAYGGPLSPPYHARPPTDRLIPRGLGSEIRGNYHRPGDSYVEDVDSSYYVRHKDFFKEGRVLAIIMSETAGESTRRPTSYNSEWSGSRNVNANIVPVKYRNHLVHTQTRRFVILRQKREFCFACPIFTYSGRATTKPGVKPEEHGIAYSWGQEPQLVKNESGLTKTSIGVVMVDGEPLLETASRIYFGIHHPIQYNVKVKDIGFVHKDHLHALNGNWNEEMGKDGPTERPHLDENSDNDSNDQSDDTDSDDSDYVDDEDDIGSKGKQPQQTRSKSSKSKPVPRSSKSKAKSKGSKSTATKPDPYLYDAKNNPYGYDAEFSPHVFHPKHNPRGYHPDHNQLGYHPSSNPHMYHKIYNPHGYHPNDKPHGYHPEQNPHVYHPANNEHGFHSKYNAHGYHPKRNEHGYHPDTYPYMYHPTHNPRGYHPDRSPHSYHPENNPYGYHYETAPYCYSPQLNPHGYHSTRNTAGYHPHTMPYNFHPQGNPYGYHSTANPSGYHPTYNPLAYHPDYNSGNKEQEAHAGAPENADHDDSDEDDGQEEDNDDLYENA